MNNEPLTCAHCNKEFEDKEPATRWITSGVLGIDTSTEENTHLTSMFHYGCLLVLRQINPTLLTLQEPDFEADDHTVIKEHIDKMRKINNGVNIYGSDLNNEA